MDKADLELGLALGEIKKWAIENYKWEYFVNFINGLKEEAREECFGFLERSKDREAAISLGSKNAFDSLLDTMDSLITASAEEAEADRQSRRKDA